MWRYHSQQPLTNFEMTPKPLLLYYWSGSIGIPGSSPMYTSTDTIIILRSCMTPGGPSTWVIPRSSWALYFTTHSRLGISLPLKRSCLRPFWTIRRSFLLIPMSGSTGTGPPTAMTEPPQTNILCGCSTSSCPTKLTRRLPMCRRTLP